MSVPDDRVLCYDGSIRHISRLPEKMRQRLSVGVRERVADHMGARDVGRDRRVAILHPHRGALVPIQTRNKPVSL